MTAYTTFGRFHKHIYRQCTIAAQTWKLQKYRVHMLYALNNNYTQPDNDT